MTTMRRSTSPWVLIFCCLTWCSLCVCVDHAETHSTSVVITTTKGPQRQQQWKQQQQESTAPPKWRKSYWPWQKRPAPNPAGAVQQQQQLRGGPSSATPAVAAALHALHDEDEFFMHKNDAFLLRAGDRNNARALLEPLARGDCLTACGFGGSITWLGWVGLPPPPPC